MPPHTTHKQLVIFSIGFPFGDSEPFLSVEVDFLSKRFENIIIIPIQPYSLNIMQTLPVNVSVMDLRKLGTFNFKRTFRDYLFVSRIFLNEFAFSGNCKLFRNIKYHLSQLFVYLEIAKMIHSFEEEGLINRSNSLYYSYWFDAGVSILSIFKKKFRKEVRFISRAHGFDVYEERREKGYIFPRQLQVRSVNKVFAISDDGKSYLTKLFPSLKGKIECSRLGTSGPLSHEHPSKNTSHGILVVSCSNLIPLKRVHKIIEVLMHCKAPVKWVHFGDGALRNDIETLSHSLPPNIKVEFRGSTDNSSILDFYTDNVVNWFMNVSETEGIPVSIMEAISFGIPVIATNVGGTKEIVTEITGILVEKDFSPEEVARLLEEKVYTEEQRKKIRLFWDENYNAAKNFLTFSEKISTI